MGQSLRSEGYREGIYVQPGEGRGVQEERGQFHRMGHLR